MSDEKKPIGETKITPVLDQAISLDQVSTADPRDQIIALARNVGKTGMATAALNEMARRYAAGEEPDIDSCGFPRVYPQLIDRNNLRVVPVPEEQKRIIREQYAAAVHASMTRATAEVASRSRRLYPGQYHDLVRPEDELRVLSSKMREGADGGFYRDTSTQPDQNRRSTVCSYCNGEGWVASTCNHTIDWPYGEQCQETCYQCKGTGKPFSPPPRPPKPEGKPKTAREFIARRKRGRRPKLRGKR